MCMITRLIKTNKYKLHVGHGCQPQFVFEEVIFLNTIWSTEMIQHPRELQRTCWHIVK